jgi:hypothetical protein
VPLVTYRRCCEQEAIAGHKLIKVIVGGEDVVLDHARTLAQSGIRAGAKLVLKSTGLLGGGGGQTKLFKRGAAVSDASSTPEHRAEPPPVLETDPTKSELAGTKQTIVALKQQVRTLQQQVDQQTSSTADAAASDASSPPEHRAEPPPVLETDPTKSELAGAKQTIVALKQQVRTLLQQVDQQTSSTADAAASDASSPPEHRAELPAMPHELILALRGLDSAGLRREFDKYADLTGEGAAAGPESKDKDTDHRMSKAGLASFMRDRGFTHDDTEVGRAMERVDTNKNGDIDFGEFCALAEANSDLEKVLQAKHLECILCYYFPRGTTLEDLATMDRAQFSAIVKFSQQTMVQLLVDLAANVAAVGKAHEGAGGGKFTGELRGGTLENFYEGVTGVCGEPDADLEEGMRREHTECPDSNVEFSTPNYFLTTTPATEWKLVLEGGSGCEKAEGKEGSVSVTGTRGCCKASGLKWLNTGNTDPTTLGLKWRAVSDTRPTEGRQLTNSMLADALASKTAAEKEEEEEVSEEEEAEEAKVSEEEEEEEQKEGAEKNQEEEETTSTARLTKVVDFTKEDLDKFGITDLRSADFIEAGGSYFKPIASTAEILANPRLAEALMHKTEFTKQEWEAFGVHGLRMHHFVKSGDTFFQPAGTEVQADVRVLRPLAHYGDFGEDGRLKWGVGDVVVVGEAFTVSEKYEDGDEVKKGLTKDTEGTVLEFNAEGGAKIAFSPRHDELPDARWVDCLPLRPTLVRRRARCWSSKPVSAEVWVPPDQFYRLYPRPSARDTPIQRMVKLGRLRRCDVRALILYTGVFVCACVGCVRVRAHATSFLLDNLSLFPVESCTCLLT